MTYNNGNINGNGLGNLGPTLYFFMKIMEANRSASQEYQRMQEEAAMNPNEDVTQQLAERLMKQFLGNYNFNPETLLQLLPFQYRGMARMLYSMNWGNVIELLTNIARTYEKNPETGQPRTTKDVVEELVKQYVRGKIIDDLTR